MKRSLLIFAWEYEGYHSKQGTALSRRITQVAEGFNANGWHVTAIHCDHRNECGDAPFKIATEANGITRIAVKLTSRLDAYNSNVLLRKLETLYYVALKGDKTSKWAQDVIGNFGSFGVKKPDYILSFYEPRVTLLLGNYFSKKLGVPWIADVQDPILEGISAGTVPLSRRWLRGVMRSAKAAVHISPEWAEADGITMGRKMETIRHAIPEQEITPAGNTNLLEEYNDTFKIFYGGSLSADIQSLSLLRQVAEDAMQRGRKVRIFVAGNENCYNLFRQELGDTYLTHLGWLSRELMNQYILSCDCTLVIPWSKERVGIPSKFYELCVYPKPIWIIGGDLGAFDSLLREWQHPPIAIGSFDYQQEALAKAMNGDNSGMFNLSACKGQYLTASDLYGEYVKLM
jgi:hypothetical protein